MKDVNWTIHRYDPSFKSEWDRMIEASRNSTFLFKRAYMDYHSDRFEDCSLIACKNNKPLALLPANRSDDTLHSHQGLSYGGWVLPTRHLDCVDLLTFWKEWLKWCLEEGIEEVSYKPLPSIYHLTPSQEDLYALFRSGATLTEANISATIDLNAEVGFNTMQRRHLAKISKSDAEVVEVVGESIVEFHDLLRQCLRERHGVMPVHTSDELIRLWSAFPNNIRFFGVKLAGELLAGVCLFRSETVDHAQYICSSPRGRDMNALTLLFDSLIRQAKSDNKRFFDFGISNENHGLFLNNGLYRQKSSFGGSGIIYNRFTFRVAEALAKSEE